MNKWFASARDISDSESSDSSEEEKKQTPQQIQNAARKAAPQQKRANYMRNLEGSSDEEEEARVVKTDKSKKLDIFAELKKDIYNHIKNNDFNLLTTDFEKFSEEIERDQQRPESYIFEKGKDGVLPLSVLRILVKLEDSITEAGALVKEKKLTLNKTNSVSYNKLKQKLKKYLPATGPSDNTYE